MSRYHAILHKLYTWFGKNQLRLYLNGTKFFRLGGGRPPRPPSKYVHVVTVRSSPCSSVLSFLLFLVALCCPKRPVQIGTSIDKLLFTTGIYKCSLQSSDLPHGQFGQSLDSVLSARSHHICFSPAPRAAFQTNSDALCQMGGTRWVEQRPAPTSSFPPFSLAPSPPFHPLSLSLFLPISFARFVKFQPP